MKKARNKNRLTDFGVWVKIRLAERRINQMQLAKQIGTDKYVVSKILYGTMPNSIYESRIIAALGGDYPVEIEACTGQMKGV